MRIQIVLIIPSLFIFSFLKGQNAAFLIRSEDVLYRIHYGFIKAGEMKVLVDTVVYPINGKGCFRIEIEGKTTGALGMFARIFDKWISYVDTSNGLSVRFERLLEENNYRKNEFTEFDRENNQAFVTNKLEDRNFELKTHRIPIDVQDMISAYFNIRHMDLTKVHTHDTIILPIFLEDSAYKIKVVFLGHKRIRTELGRIRTFMLSPVMPGNPIFAKEHPIIAYFSDDYRRIPLKMEASLKVGSVEVDIDYYKGLSKKRKKH